MTTRNPELSLSYDAFRAWLGTLAPSSQVGCSGNGNHCPLATWLITQGHRAAFVTEGTIDLLLAGSDQFTNYITPGWARTFVEMVDGWGRGTRITAADALEILDRIAMLINGKEAA